MLTCDFYYVKIKQYLKKGDNCKNSLVNTMGKLVLTTDSCSDFGGKAVKEMGIKVIPLSVEIDGKSYRNYPDEREISTKQLYSLLREKKVATTSLINVGEFIEFFEEIVKAGDQILYIAFSSALSGTFNSSRLAVEELKTKYPDCEIVTIDSLCASSGQGLLVWYAWKLKEEGKSLQEIALLVESMKLKVVHLFTVDDLGTLKRGGRLSASKAWLGTLLGVKPILHVNEEGKLVPLKKARGRKASLESMLELVDEKIENPAGQTVFISHGDCLEDATYIGDKIKAKYKIKEVIYNQIGPVIGAHSGPGTIAVFFFGKER